MNTSMGTCFPHSSLVTPVPLACPVSPPRSISGSAGCVFAHCRAASCKEERVKRLSNSYIIKLRNALPVAAQECNSSFVKVALLSAPWVFPGLFLLPIAPALASDGSTSFQLVNFLALADLDPAIANLLLRILGPIFVSLNFLFIIRIVMSWYPKLPVNKFPYVIAFAPTEPVLEPTRRLVPPIGGVDISPVIWVAIISFLNEILLGPQGLLVLLSQQQG